MVDPLLFRLARVVATLHLGQRITTFAVASLRHRGTPAFVGHSAFDYITLHQYKMVSARHPDEVAWTVRCAQPEFARAEVIAGQRAQDSFAFISEDNA
jgi:hypothetical protein